MIHTAEITLRIVYDDQDDGFMVPRAHPRDWDWEVLLDVCPPDESVEVVG